MPLITLADYKSLMGVQAGDTRDDAQVTALLDAATRAVEVFTGRNFTVSTGVATSRDFLYDGSGFLDIDDCVSITSVETVIPNASNYVMLADEWTAMPAHQPIFYYLVLHGGVHPFAISPEMGFERNLDQYPVQTFKNPTVRVTATWGWPEVPSDVKLATALTIKQFVVSAGGGGAEGLTAEAIEGFSRSWGSRTGGGSTALAIPNRARDLLVAYQRVYV